MSNLIFFREKQLLTQDELAEKSGVSVRTIQRIEAGANLKGHTLKSIALALEINPDELTNSLLTLFPQPHFQIQYFRN